MGQGRPNSVLFSFVMVILMRIMNDELMTQVKIRLFGIISAKTMFDTGGWIGGGAVCLHNFTIRPG